MKLHRFSRTELLIGKAGLNKLQKSFVAIFGIGGVGSYAAEALARAGVGKIALIDFDEICLTNSNRQIHAMKSSVGKAKVDVMGDRIRDINCDAEVVAIKKFASKENIEELLSPKPDYVLDAIDHFTAKKDLIIYCKEQNINVISSMGAANKLDPSKIAVADIKETTICRMARSMRKILRQNGIDSGVEVVYSTEPHREIDASNSAKCGANCICPNRGEQQFSCENRRVILGSISYIPAIFGLTMAGAVINKIIGTIEHNK